MTGVLIRSRVGIDFRLPALNTTNSTYLALLCGNRRLNSSRTHGVAANAVLGEIVRAVARHLNDGTFHGCIRGAIRLPQEAANAALPHNGCSASGLHVGKGCFCQLHRRSKCDNSRGDRLLDGEIDRGTRLRSFLKTEQRRSTYQRMAFDVDGS